MVRVLLMMLVTLLEVDPVIAQEQKHDKLPITWVTNLQGDFSFKDKWDYPEGVYINESGQVTCDGLCPPGTDVMKDDLGNILKDSIQSFYRLVDTSHLFYSLECEASCYEWAGSNHISVVRSKNNTVICETQQNAATHCSLILKITGDECIAYVDINTIADMGQKEYYCSGGTVLIEKPTWEQGIMKAVFNLTFYNTENIQQPISWRGSIYTLIE